MAVTATIDTYTTTVPAGLETTFTVTVTNGGGSAETISNVSLVASAPGTGFEFGQSFPVGATALPGASSATWSIPAVFFAALNPDSSAVSVPITVSAELTASSTGNVATTNSLNMLILVVNPDEGQDVPDLTVGSFRFDTQRNGGTLALI